MACERSYLRVIVKIAILLSSGTAAWAQFGGLSALKEQMQERAFEKAASALLTNDLPIILDATTALPTVDTLPGGVFKPRPLAVSADMLSKPLPPGDYVVNVTAFCTEYSVHRPGQGVAYKLAPLKGHAAQAVSTLLWRGMKAHVPERRLMSLTWAIQSGLSISEMPATFKADYDRLIPDYESDLSGDFFQELEDTYKKASRLGKLPPMEVLLEKMGAAGKTVLAAKRQREALMAKGQSDEIKEQTLFAGQESGVYTPVKAEEGPWTERIPGVAYMRYKIVGGNIASNNVMEIRIVGGGSPVAKVEGPARLVEASYTPGQGFGSSLTSPTLMSILGAQENSSGGLTADGMIGYSQGQGAQALIPVLPPPKAPADDCTKHWTVDVATLAANIHANPDLYSDQVGNVLNVDTGAHHAYNVLEPWGFKVDADSAITSTDGADRAQRGYLKYINNMYEWSGTSTYGDGLKAYSAATRSGITISEEHQLVDQYNLGDNEPIILVYPAKSDSPNIIVPVMDGNRPLTRVAYTKAFKLYMGCVTDTEKTFHTLAIIRWKVLYNGSYSSTEKKFTPDPPPGSGVSYDQPQVDSGPPVTAGPLANCEVGYLGLLPAGSVGPPPFVGKTCKE